MSTGGRIVQMDDITGAGWTTLGTPGVPGRQGVNQFSQPWGIFVDGADRIYVADNGNWRIVRADDITGTGWTTFGHSGTSTGEFVGPVGISVDGAGRIYILDPVNNWIIARMDDMTGRGWTTLGTQGTGVKQFGGRDFVSWALSGFFVDRTGRIYVADSGNSRIVRVDDITGVGWTTLGTYGTGVNQFSHPHGIFVDGAGRIYVADSGNNRIVRVNDMTGTGWKTLGTSGRGANQFSELRGIFVDQTGRIYMVDVVHRQFSGRIARVNDMTGAGWTTLDTQGVPLGIFVR